eukprot:jgi/Chlat1/7624/Chrsp64S07101
MAHKAIGLSDDLHDYLLSVGVRTADAAGGGDQGDDDGDVVVKQLAALRDETKQRTGRWFGMCSPPDNVAFLQMIVRMVGAKNIVEVGVFTGYTALGMAAVMPPGGRLIACDVVS